MSWTPAAPGSAEEAARTYDREAQRKKRKARLARGVCTYCARNPPRPGLQTCAECGTALARKVKKHSDSRVVVYALPDLQALADGRVPAALRGRAQVALRKRQERLARPA